MFLKSIFGVFADLDPFATLSSHVQAILPKAEKFEFDYRIYR
jgi:hypothetical protein